jgi:hypothetical protein
MRSPQRQSLPLTGITHGATSFLAVLGTKTNLDFPHH